MRIHVAYKTCYHYSEPVRSIVQLLRLTPRSHEGQHVLLWRVDMNVDGTLRPATDAFGNVVHYFYAEVVGLDRLELIVTGEVETWDTVGVVRGSFEPLPDQIFLRETTLTQPSPELAAFAEAATASAGEPLGKLHALLSAVHQSCAFQPGQTDSTTTAAEAFALKRGVCQDLAHVFIAGARHLGIPARYVSGHLARTDGEIQDAGHGWAEALVPQLGWVGFDPANGTSTTATHVRVAVGLDYGTAAPVRGSRQGGGEERLRVELSVGEAVRQRQS